MLSSHLYRLHMDGGPASSTGSAVQGGFRTYTTILLDRLSLMRSSTHQYFGLEADSQTPAHLATDSVRINYLIYVFPFTTLPRFNSGLF